MPEMGKWLIAIGLVIAVIGGIILFVGKIPWLGKLPGDIYIKRENFSLFFPLGTCILISAISLSFSGSSGGKSIPSCPIFSPQTPAICISTVSCYFYHKEIH